MKLYLVNVSKQIQEFWFWQPDAPTARGPVHMRIHPGFQAQLGGDMPSSDVVAIIAQHEKYGLVSVTEAIDARRPCGLVYSLDAPASAEDMRDLIANNAVLATRETGRLHEEAAAATLAQQLAVKGLGQMRPTHIVTETIEEKRDPEAPSGLAHIIDVSRDGGPSRFSRDHGLAH